MRFFYEEPFSEAYNQAWARIIRHKKFLGNKTKDEALETAEADSEDILTYWMLHDEERVPVACRTHGMVSLWRELMAELSTLVDLYKQGSYMLLANTVFNAIHNYWLDRFGSDMYQLQEANDKYAGLEDWLMDLQPGINPLRLIDNHSTLKQDRDGVRVMTVHKSKGLEFNNVGLWNVGQATFPLKHGDPTEERRLLYVAVTRAKKNLGIFLNSPQKEAWVYHPLVKNIPDHSQMLLDALEASN
jgi:ATP-dependent exoDNAse (exonuclease V) beta subunit